MIINYGFEHLWLIMFTNLVKGNKLLSIKDYKTLINNLVFKVEIIICISVYIIHNNYYVLFV